MDENFQDRERYARFEWSTAAAAAPGLRRAESWRSPQRRPALFVNRSPHGGRCMNKKLSKLILNKESLRRITSPELERVAGGFSGPPTYICGSGCIGNTCATRCPHCP
jgi:hypothetical protein